MIENSTTAKVWIVGYCDNIEEDPLRLKAFYTQTGAENFYSKIRWSYDIVWVKETTIQ